MIQVYLPYVLIQHACENNYLRQLAYFIWLKKKYSNSCFYGYSINNLSKKTGLSRTTIRALLRFYKCRGWVREHCGNLVFDKTLRIIQNMRIGNGARYIGFETENSPEDIYLKLYFEILKNKKRQIDFRKTHDKYKAGGNRYVTGICVSDPFRISIRRLSLLFNCSTAKVSNILNHLNQQNLLQIQRQFKIIRRITRKEYNSISELLPISTFVWKGQLCRRETNQYLLTA